MPRAFVIGLVAILILGDAHSALFESNLARSTYVEAQDQTGELWREAEPVKVIIDSTADWGRIVFDDLNGTNTNGLRIRSILSIGWLAGKKDDDGLAPGRKRA